MSQCALGLRKVVLQRMGRVATISQSYRYVLLAQCRIGFTGCSALPPQNYSKHCSFSSQSDGSAGSTVDCKELCARVARKLHFSPTDSQRWYSVTVDDFIQSGGSKILDQYQDDVYQLLTAAYPSLPLEPWRFVGGPLRCLGDQRQRKIFLNWLAENLSVQEPIHWKTKLNKANLSKLGIEISPVALRKALGQEQPHVDWASIFRTTADLDPPKRVMGATDTKWDVASARQHFDSLLSRTSFQHLGLAGWYSISNTMISREIEACSIIRHLGDGFLSSTLQVLYPEHPWEHWRLGALPSGYWDYGENLQRFLASILPRDSGLASWYNIAASTLAGVPGGSNLLSRYDNQLHMILKKAYPNHDWKPWKFKVVSSSIWQLPATQRSFLDDAAMELGISEKSQWYFVSSSRLYDFGGRTLLDNYYERSAALCVTSVYSEHSWEMWRFVYPGCNWWTNPDHARQYLQNLAARLQIHSPEDWYFVKLGRGSLIEPHIRQQGFDLPSCLAAAFPEHSWQVWRFGSTKSSWSPSKNREKSTKPLVKQTSNDITSAEQEPPKTQDGLRELYKKMFASKDT